MLEIVLKREIAPRIFEMVVHAPNIAAKAMPGHFVIAMPDEVGERIPLTIADFDREAGTVTLVLMTVGVTSTKLSHLNEGDSPYALIGPLGIQSEIKNSAQ